MTEKDKKPQQSSRTLFSIPLNGCLYLIILAAIATMSVKGCKIVNMKYDEAKAKHEMVMDSLNKAKAVRLNDTIPYRGR